MWKDIGNWQVYIVLRNWHVLQYFQQHPLIEIGTKNNCLTFTWFCFRYFYDETKSDSLQIRFSTHMSFYTKIGILALLTLHVEMLEHFLHWEINRQQTKAI